MKLTTNFKLSEFTHNRWATHDQQQRINDSVTPEIKMNLLRLAANLQVLRDHVQQPVHINIAFRPKWWELLKGRKGTSQHTLGKAADIRVDGISPHELSMIIEDLIQTGQMDQGGLSAYPTFVHYDIRGVRARW